MSLRLALSFVLGSALAAGCYYEEQCPTIQGDSLGAPQQPDPGQRNPYTGQCESFGGGGGGGGGGTTCGDFGGPVEAEADRAPLPDWGVCDGFCESLSEADCLAAEECRTSYVDGCPAGFDCDALIEPTFNQCWAVTPGGGFNQDGCNVYDADECARHNECAAVHSGSPGAELGNFVYCMDEIGEQPDPGSCEGETLCPTLPPDCPENTVPGIGDGCWTGYCIPVSECEALPACSAQAEDACVGRADCEPVYEGIDCTCVGEDCTCADWVFATCS